jgi:Xaa-Pro aminopeptidase
MRHAPIDPQLFVQNRERLSQLLLPKSVAVVNANDVLPTNADGSLVMVPNSDLFYLSGIEQEESILLLSPDAVEEKNRCILFLREPNEHLKIWEGYKHSKEDAQKISGVTNIRWLSEFPLLFKALAFDADHLYLNTNEHKRSCNEVQTRDERFIADCKARYPLHQYRRLAPLLHQLRVVKSPVEVALIQQAIDMTEAGFRRVCGMVRPGVHEHEIEAEFAHEFIRRRGKFSYNPIIASGGSSCVLHYNQNDQLCKDGDVLLLDVGAAYGNYCADMTRTIPVSGKFTPRQRQVYDSVLRVMRQCIANATVGKLHREWQADARTMMNEELLSLGLITKEDVEKQTEDAPACKPYYMHGLGHVLGLDVHDVGQMAEPFGEGWVLTVEPGIYIEKEGFGIRLENDILVTKDGPVDLFKNIPVEAAEIEELMCAGR